MNRAVIGVGSNIEPKIHTDRVRELLTQKYHNVRSSCWVWTKPIGNAKQPDFLNGAIYLETLESKERVLDQLWEIEQTLGRKPEQHGFAARTIDLDLIVWNGEILHADFFTRDFLREAVLEVLPSLVIPPSPRV